MSEQQSTDNIAHPTNAATSGHKRSNSDLQPQVKKQKMNTEHAHQHLDNTHIPTDRLSVPGQPSTDQHPLQLTYRKGDMLVDVPKDCVLVHACNTQGVWGSGIAKSFKRQYPKAYAFHRDYCTKKHTKAKPVETGTAQLLAPLDEDRQHWIGCVFTSAKYGKNKDKPDQILENTNKSIQMLLELISQMGTEPREIRMCKINSGKFGVPWEKTEAIMKGIVLKSHWPTKIEVWEPE
ncbi:ADP-ribose 1''-phosphate phosphatase [Curvularia kusanoi]|uniref:ADP-ribose 1''-phosphate phosphatase n=1 Tax=Curvularia kusanoi TaxID=90978 RepID=A0A9P4THB0_CURKU|nr:ADP-ribose 1''-phosphate phosphatase [Curvularia kusanoi]